MSSKIAKQIRQIKQTIAEIEAQRPILGDAAVDVSLEPFRQKLSDLEEQLKPPPEESPVTPTRQRKLVTLLYMDVVGSTAMTQDLDPEDNLEIMDNAMTRLAAPIGSHGGHITRYTGDGFKAVFGNPISREDDPEQAIRAGLKILEYSQALSQDLEKEWGIEDFYVRIGIDTGLAALGGQTEAENTVKGRVVNLAKRIESAAPPGGLLISHNTYRHVRGVFNVEPQEPIKAKGFPEPVPVYLVRYLKPRAFRVQTRGVEGVETRMVGRETELKYLQDALLTAVEEGEGQVVTITGEAGVGKSRLLYEFQNWMDFSSSPEAWFFQGRSKQDARGLPYSLLRDMFTSRFHVLDDDSGEQVRQKIENGFYEVFGEDEGVMRAHILGQLLGYDFSTSPHLKGVLNDPEQLRNRALMYLVQYFQALSHARTVVILLEDIHWADDSSLDMVMRLGEHTPQLRLLIVSAARPSLYEMRPYWGEGQVYHTLLELRPLSKRESRQLLAEILQLVEDIPIELRELVVSGAEGNPFYLEELIKMLVEDGVVISGEETWQIDLARLNQVDVPATLAGVLQARLDSLPLQEKAVLQQASVVGRLFWDRIVTYIQSEAGDKDDPQFIPIALTSLRNRELVYRHEESAFTGAVEYLFKHDMLREVTYESVLKRLRKTYHVLVADWLIENCGDRIGEYSGLIAAHLLLAGKENRACEYFIRAGENALNSYANSEAENYYRQALELTLSVNHRAALMSGLGEALNRQGQSKEAKLIWEKTINLYHKIGESDKVGGIYARLSWLLWYTDDWLKARDMCQEGLKLLEGESESRGYARLLGEAGRTALFSNDYDQAIPLCQQAIDMAKRLGDTEVEAEVSITLALHNDDPIEGINILEEVAEKAEANGLSRTAARAHNNIGAVMDNQLIDLNSSRMHFLRAAEIQKRIGYVEGLLFLSINLYTSLIQLGELNTVEEEVVDFLQSSNVPENRAHKFLYEMQPYLLFYRGEWFEALGAHREILKELQDREILGRIADTKMQIAFYLLELNRFGYNDDLSEAESILLENIEDNLIPVDSNSGLVLVYIQQGRLKDAHNHFSQSKQLLAQSKISIFEKVFSPWIEYEFAIAEGRWGEAIAVSESLLDTYQRGGYRYDSARQLINLGDALVGRNEPGDLDRARKTYQHSLEIFTEMGAPGYIKVLEERLVDIGD